MKNNKQKRKHSIVAVFLFAAVSCFIIIGQEVKSSMRRRSMRHGRPRSSRHPRTMHRRGRMGLGFGRDQRPGGRFFNVMNSRGQIIHHLVKKIQIMENKLNEHNNAIRDLTAAMSEMQKEKNETEKKE